MEVGNHRKYLIRTFFKNYLELNRTEAEERETVESIRNGVEFKGANLWILIFAIFIASLGLNVNSTAVIIGAMLISPLMGPIMDKIFNPTRSIAAFQFRYGPSAIAPFYFFLYGRAFCHNRQWQKSAYLYGHCPHSTEDFLIKKWS